LNGINDWIETGTFTGKMFSVSKSFINEIKERKTMRIYFSKAWFLGQKVRKSEPEKEKDEKFSYFKKKILEHLNSLAKDREELKKSLLVMEKANYPVGTIREWKGKKYIKVAQGKWRPKYDSHSRGAKLSIAALKRKADTCKSSEELLQLILENRSRFSDDNGRPLPIIQELSDYVSGKNDSIESEKADSYPEKNYPKYKGTGQKAVDFIAKNKGGQVRGAFNRSEIGDIDIVWGKITDKDKHKGYGLAHIVDKHGKNSLSAIGDVINNGKLAQNSSNGRVSIEKDGFKVAIRRSYNGKEKTWVVTGFKKESGTSTTPSSAKNYTVETSPKPSYSNISQNEEKSSGISDLKQKTVNSGNGGIERNKQLAKKMDSILFERTESVHGETPQSDESLTSTNIPQNEKKSSGISDIRKKYESFKSVQGNKKTVTLPNGDKIKCHYKLVEADAPTASHDERTYAPTEGFPKNESGQNINDRDYQNDVDAQISVRNIAANFNSLALESPPIVTKDGIVISGNNRTMSSKLAARNGTDKVYLSDLREMIDEYGLEESDLDGFKNPRLVLEVDEEHKGGYTTEEFAQFNRDTKKTMSNVEKAVKLTKTLNEQKISSIASELSNYDTMGELYADPKGSQAFVSKLIESGIIGDNEKAQYCKSDGTLNDTGKDFVETVLVGSVLNEGNIRNLDGAGGKRIRQKLVRAILPLIENKGNGKEYSFNGELNTAVEIAVNATKEQKTIDDYLAQGSLFDEEKPDEVTSKLAKIIHDEGEKAFAQRMKGLGAGLRDSARGICDIFLGGVESKQSLMEQFLDIKKSMSDFVGRLLKEIA
jgi:hypothetical protein